MRLDHGRPRTGADDEQRLLGLFPRGAAIAWPPRPIASSSPTLCTTQSPIWGGSKRCRPPVTAKTARINQIHTTLRQYRAHLVGIRLAGIGLRPLAQFTVNLGDNVGVANAKINGSDG
ncbi:MAG: hypothetical protein R3E79_49755 [Caldilineaceae bacterium]